MLRRLGMRIPLLPFLLLMAAMWFAVSQDVIPLTADETVVTVCNDGSAMPPPTLK